MHKSRQDLFDFFDSHEISHSTVDHAPIFTVEEGQHIKASMPGGHTKNLFLTDKDGAIILIAAEAHSELKLNRLHRLIGTRRLSFGSPDLMEKVLGVTPGSVTAFALMNDTGGRVRFLVDAALLDHDPVNFHPLTNTGTTAIARDDLERFARATGHGFEVVDFTQLLDEV